MKIDREHIDIHVHMGFQADMEAFVKACRKLNVAVAVNACGPMYGQPGNDATEAAMKKYPDTVIGMGYIGLGRGDTPETVADLHRRGFKGLKMIAPTKDYDDEEFFPIYARAEELNMPILFHTGVVVRSDVWLENMKKSGRPLPPHPDPRTFNISSKRMEPMCVDLILRAFPNLNCILAHFGSTGRRDTSQGIIRWNPNAYGDLTEFSWSFELDKSKRGWHIEQRHVDMFMGILKPLQAEKMSDKLLFATDLSTDDPQLLDAKIESHKAVYTALGIDKSGQKKMLRDTAARLLGIG
jgi:uncharacterized protein